MAFTIQHNVSLLPYNTFRVDVSASHFVEINTADDFHKLMQTPQFKKYDKLVLGGGSNMLLTQDLSQTLVIKNNITSKRLIDMTDESITIMMGAGCNWHEFVMYCSQRNRRGIENLALIPGTIGASPIQNIGAYGVEVKDVITSVKGFDLKTGNIRALNNIECHFDYRDSVFKQEFKDKFFITHVTFKLSKIKKTNLTYGALSTRATQQDTNNTEITALSIANEVIRIRNTKLPSIVNIGTAGSFFKNPFISTEKHAELLTTFPNLRSRETNQEDVVKISAGQLLDLCDCKGERQNDAATYEKHALVLVNHGKATGADMRSFAQHLQQKVLQKTGILLETEVNIIPQ